MLATVQVDQRDTHRLIPAQYAEGGASVLTRLTDDGELLDGIFELDNATNDRLLAESGLLPGIDARELVFGIPSYRIINAAFCHPAPDGSRFNSTDRGAWYAGFEVETSQAEVAYHKQLWLQETDWNEKKSLIMSIIARIFAPNSMTFERRGNTEIVCLQPAMLLRRRSLPGFWRPAPRGLCIPASAALVEPASRVFGRF